MEWYQAARRFSKVSAMALDRTRCKGRGTFALDNRNLNV